MLYSGCAEPSVPILRPAALTAIWSASCRLTWAGVHASGTLPVPLLRPGSAQRARLPATGLVSPSSQQAFRGRGSAGLPATALWPAAEFSGCGPGVGDFMLHWRGDGGEHGLVLSAWLGQEVDSLGFNCSLQVHLTLQLEASNGSVLTLTYVDTTALPNVSRVWCRLGASLPPEQPGKGGNWAHQQERTHPLPHERAHPPFSSQAQEFTVVPRPSACCAATLRGLLVAPPAAPAARTLGRGAAALAALATTAIPAIPRAAQSSRAAGIPGCPGPHLLHSQECRRRDRGKHGHVAAADVHQQLWEEGAAAIRRPRSAVSPHRPVLGNNLPRRAGRRADAERRRHRFGQQAASRLAVGEQRECCGPSLPARVGHHCAASPTATPRALATTPAISATNAASSVTFA